MTEEIEELGDSVPQDAKMTNERQTKSKLFFDIHLLIDKH